MSAAKRPIIFATRGSPLAVAQTNMILGQCQVAFPDLQFEAKIIKTTGDKLQATAPESLPQEGTKGLFTKELELALLNGEADLAVHSLKDLPTELPAGLKLGAVSQRADVRDVLVYRGEKFPGGHSTSSTKRGYPSRTRLQQFPSGATIATSSTRRQAQLLALHSGLKVVPIRGNVGTRLQKLANQPQLDALVLAAAGLERLRIRIASDGHVTSDVGGAIPEGLFAEYFSAAEMLPCVGQAALGIETRVEDERIERICAALNDSTTHQCVAAERAFLRAMGGGCMSPVAAYGEVQDGQLRLRGISFRNGAVRQGERNGQLSEAEKIGGALARDLSE